MPGTIFEIQHFSVHDGPGIRCTVFFKGCQMRCLWCHNPESIPTRPRELSFVESKCIGCGACFKLCPVNAHEMRDGRHQIHRDKCTLCGKCADTCPPKALTMLGREATAQEVIDEVLRDKAYYGQEGGMTLSGGEAMLQRNFVRELFALAKAEGINTALETNLAYDYSLLDGVKDNVDLFLVDWKESDPEKHLLYTGVPNDRIYKNIGRLHEEGRSTLLRCPIIPGLNDRSDHFLKIAELTKEFPELLGAELLPYHSLGISKNSRFGLSDLVETVSSRTPSDAEVAGWVAFIREHGGRVINET